MIPGRQLLQRRCTRSNLPAFTLEPGGENKTKESKKTKAGNLKKDSEKKQREQKDNVIKKKPTRVVIGRSLSWVARLAREERKKLARRQTPAKPFCCSPTSQRRGRIRICAAVLFPDLRDLALLLAMPCLRRRRRRHRHNLLVLLPAATGNLSRSLRGRERRKNKKKKQRTRPKTLKEFACRLRTAQTSFQHCSTSFHRLRFCVASFNF